MAPRTAVYPFYSACSQGESLQPLLLLVAPMAAEGITLISAFFSTWALFSASVAQWLCLLFSDGHEYFMIRPTLLQCDLILTDCMCNNPTST